MSTYEQAKERVTVALLEPVRDMIAECDLRVAAAERRVKELDGVLEQLRPVWAQGWTSDSMAAQASASALSALWKALGVTDQTAAMARMRQLLFLVQGGENSSIWAERAAGTWHPGDEA